jgi:CRISPR/Cas system-associated protein Cas7 (RAMP superfamily)
MSCKKSNKIKLKTRKAASKRFTFKKRGEYRVIDILLPEDFKIEGGEVKSDNAENVNLVCKDAISIVEKRSRISIQETNWWSWSIRSCCHHV